MITFLSTKMPKVDIPLEKIVKPIHHHGSGENQTSLLRLQGSFFFVLKCLSMSANEV